MKIMRFGFLLFFTINYPQHVEYNGVFRVVWKGSDPEIWVIYFFPKNGNILMNKQPNKKLQILLLFP